MTKTIKQFGLWESPLSAEMLAGEARLSDVQWAGDGKTLVWLESRDGRGVLMVRRPDEVARVVNDELSVRGGVGYGGGEFCVAGDRVFFAASDGRLYRAHLDKGLPKAITPPFGKVASPTVSPDGRWVAFVHSHDDVDRIAVVDSEGARWPVVVAAGGDFYMQPSWHPDSDRLVWVRWDHPQMPWNGTYLESAPLRVEEDTLIVGASERLAGADDVAVQQPLYSPDGEKLAFLSDQSGYWQLYVREVKSGEEKRVSTAGKEYAGPAWVQGLRHYGWLDEQSLLAIRAWEGVYTLERLSLDKKPESLPYFERYSALSQLALGQQRVALIGQSSLTPPRVLSVRLDLDEGQATVERFGSSERLSEEDLSAAQVVSWPAPKKSPVDTVFGLYYAPTNQKFDGIGKPPALVMIHGGPTSQRVAGWEARNQFFASRGFAVIDVNYRGSTGYGREYMEALFGNWGVVDVEDAIGAAKFLGEEGLADPDKIVIMGGSAGGYTVLQTLSTHPGVFKAGVCLYGISDLFALQMGTHKFEAHYNDSLLGALPEAADIFRERSPLFKADKIKDALAIYHGKQDKVVPLDQAEAIVGSLRRRGVDHLYHVYEDEGHGWRRGESIVHFHNSLLEFLIKYVVFG